MTNTKPLQILMLGDPGTGKTNLWSRLVKNHLNPKYEPTTGMNIGSHSLLVGDQRVDMDLWDLAGHKKWLRLADGLLRDADGILLVYDISNPATFENLTTWLRLIRQATSKTVIQLVGNKNDLQSKVSRKEAKRFAADNGLSSIETSALNDTNVHLAFESMAQEINVVKQSVSESPLSSTNSFAQKDLKASSDDDNQQEKPFQVVLIDIEQAAYDRNIVCVEKPLEEANLEFIAISYRWGEVQEQVIDTKLGYMASVTSFSIYHFYQLCRHMMKETDLGSIKYVWVDAICVDQNNHARRKATIYQMSNIYHRAAYILAVPDLHLGYLRKSQIFIGDLVTNAWNFNKFMYYLLHGKMDQVAQVKEEWYDKMGIPKGMAREMLTKHTRERFTDCLQAYHLQDADSPCQDDCQHNCHNKFPMDCHNTPKAMPDYLQYSINNCHEHPKNTTMVHENSDCALCSLQMEICKHQRQIKNESVPVANEKWLACVLREFQYDNYRNSVEERAGAVVNLMKYLEYLIKDWSSRVWVVSECNIAKTKPSRKMKFWFLSLQTDWEDVKKLDFFVFNFGKELPLINRPSDRVGDSSDVSYKLFQRLLKTQLNDKSFLQMMLGSKASRNEDRFYAVFPSSEYKDMLTNREVVSSWQIDNIVSVKLKLYELMTTKDKLALLTVTAKQKNMTTCTLPAFANIDETSWYTITVEEYNDKDQPCNFDLNNDATLRLVPPMENGFQFHKLNLSPKMYYVLRPDEDDNLKKRFEDRFNGNKRLWETLEINYVDDELVHVYIPLYMRNIDRHELDTPTNLIVLFGSFEKNKWLIGKELFNNFHISLQCSKFNYSWNYYDNSDGKTTFDIY